MLYSGFVMKQAALTLKRQEYVIYQIK